jgi:hypothetical protein
MYRDDVQHLWLSPKDALWNVNKLYSIVLTCAVSAVIGTWQICKIYKISLLFIFLFIAAHLLLVLVLVCLLLARTNTSTTLYLTVSVSL